MADLRGSKTHDNLKDAFAGESQANRRYLYGNSVPIRVLPGLTAMRVDPTASRATAPHASQRSSTAPLASGASSR